MDPLSVAGSVVGLISAGTQIVPMLYNLSSAVKDAPIHAQAAVSELGDITIILVQLQKYIDGRAQAPIQRLNLITVEHITATLADCVMTFSELDAMLKSIHVDQGPGLKAWDRAKWVMRKDEVGSLINRLQNHKFSFTLMLNIIQCASMSEAESNMDRLCDIVNEVLQSNRRLSLRLRNIENAVTNQNLYFPTADSKFLNSNVNATTKSDETDELDPDVKHFEDLLNNSHVYQHAERHGNRPPLIENGRATLAFSICSSLTLGDVSKISVYALPIYAKELSNPECYNFAHTPTFDQKISPVRPSNGAPKKLAGMHKEAPGFTLIAPGFTLSWWKKRQHAKAVKAVPDSAVFRDWPIRGELNPVEAEGTEYEPPADTIRGGAGIVRAMNRVQNLAKVEEPGSEPHADSIRGAAGITRAMDRVRRKREIEDFKKLYEARMEPIGEEVEIEWDRLRRRKTIRASVGESLSRTRTIHPPLGVTHFPDEEDNEDNESERDKFMRPRPAQRRQFSFHNVFERETARRREPSLAQNLEEE